MGKFPYERDMAGAVCSKLCDGLTIYPFICNAKAMFKCPPCASKALPKEYRAVAEKLFPAGGFPEGMTPSAEAAAAFATVLGIGEDYKRVRQALVSGQDSGKFLEDFQNNLDLLIQKTWVEKAEEDRKERLLDDVPSLITSIEKEDYSQALEEFGAILEELAYLFFGTQSQKDDFSEYALRIDAQMGLFWWYGGQINAARGAPWVKNAERSVSQALLLLGICYLTNF